MSDTSPNNRQTKSGSSLAHAAQRLAKAAATLADAANAVSIAANDFSSEVLTHNAQSNDPASLTSGIVARIISYLADPEPSLVKEAPSKLDAVTETTKQVDPEPEDEECTNPEDSDYNISDGAELFENPSAGKAATSVPGGVGVVPCSTDPMSLDQLRSDPTPPPPTIPTETEIVTEPNQAYRILLDNEADVLFFACALIRNRQKVVCYMNHTITACNSYKSLIHDVTAMSVHAITKPTPIELETVGKNFMNDRDSILLLPETVCPSLSLGDTDSWVIHVGWPADEQRYEAQRKAHGAKNNILVAYTQDENLYPAGAGVMRQSKPWPGDVGSFRVSVALWRPLFNNKLIAVPSEIKAKVYQDWIGCHAFKGYRSVRSWSSIDLMHRANLYLLDALRYRDPNSQESGSTMQVALPEVSAGFVAHHKLESAVEAGILRVKSSSSGLNHASSLSRGDFVPPGTTLLNEQGIAGGSSHPWSGGRATTRVPTSSVPAPPHPPYGQDTRSTTFKPTLGLTYFALAEQFDAIPLTCFLALSSACAKVIIFLDDSALLSPYQKLINIITGPDIDVIAPGNQDHYDEAQTNQAVARLLMAYTRPAILLLPFKPGKLPPALEKSKIDCCIYWGACGFVPMVHAKKYRTRFECPRTIVIMTTSQKGKLGHLLIDVEEHPSSPDLLDLSVHSWLSPMRKATGSALAANPHVVKALYEAHLSLLAKVPRTELSAEEVASRINHYSAKILLRGNLEDGSRNFPPVAGKVATSAQLIWSFDLQPAVQAGKLIIG